MRWVTATFLISIIVCCFALLACFTVFVFAQEPADSDQTQSCSDDFGDDSGFWQYLGVAYRDKTNQNLVLTTTQDCTAGAVFFKAPIQGSFVASFRYKCYGGWQGDGFTMFFYKQKYDSLDCGGSLGFSSGDHVVPGYGIEFDGWPNIAEDFRRTEPGLQNLPGDPSGAHIALIKDYVGNHLTYVNDLRVADGNWHQVTINVQGSSLSVSVDGVVVLQWSGTLDRTHSCLGFSAGNGQCGTNWHLIDDFEITARNLKKTSMTTSCSSAPADLGFNVQIHGVLTFEGNGVPDAPVFLSYSVTAGKTWQDLTVVNTAADGRYSASWLALVTGNYQVKATYEGDENYLGTTTAINFTVTQSVATSSEGSSSTAAASDISANGTHVLTTNLPMTYGVAMVAVTVLLAVLCMGLLTYIRRTRRPLG